jgi:hypothetical protein
MAATDEGHVAGDEPERKTAAEQLGLPRSDSATLADSLFADAYRAFCASLTVGDSTVEADPEFFSGVVDGDSIDIPRLQLLAALVRPNRDQLTRIKHRVLPSRGSFNLNWGRPNTGTHEPVVSRAFSEFKQFASENAASPLRSSQRPTKVLAQMAFYFSPGPGTTQSHELEVTTFDSQWALVLSYENSELEPSFPWIRGFAAVSDLPWSVAALLAIDRFGTSLPDDLESFGLPEFEEWLLALCWIRDEDGLSWGQYLLDLPRDLVRKLQQECAALSYREIFARFADAYFNLDEEDEENAGPPDADLVRRVAAVRASRGREYEEMTRVGRGLAWLREIGTTPAINDEDLVQRVARQFEAVPSVVALEILSEGLKDPIAARGSLAVANLRVNLQSADDLFPLPRTATSGLAHGLARRARAILNGILSEDEARGILERAKT